jgi:hypothetical protein
MVVLHNQEVKQSVKYLQAFEFSFKVDNLDYFEPPILELTVKNEADEESTFVSPIAITSLNFYQFDTAGQHDQESWRQDSEEQGMNLIVPSKAASEILGSPD